MIPKNEILERLRNCKTDLLKFGVSKIGLFGSAKRGDANQNSDIDILIDFDSDKETFNNFMNACNFLEISFGGQKIDIVSEKGLSQYIDPYILKEVEYV